MKRLLFAALVSCLLVGVARGQSILTVGQAYDFDIGDLFQWVRNTNTAPPEYITKIISGKTFSLTQDTIYYTYDWYYYQPQSCQSCPAIYDTMLSQALIVDHLADDVEMELGVPPHYWYPFCVDTAGYTGKWLDSVYYDTSFCAKLTTSIHSMTNLILDDSCLVDFEPVFYERDYGEGLGMRRYFQNECSQGGAPGCSYTETMTFYRKGLDSCGFRFITPLPVGFLDPLTEMACTVTPNPFSWQFQVQFVEPQEECNIMLSNVLGQVVWTTKMSGREWTFDGASLKPGAYFLKLENAGASTVLKILRE